MASNPLFHFLQNIVTLNGSFIWDYVWGYLFASLVLQGVVITLMLAVLAQALGSLIGLLLYFLRRSQVRALRVLTNGYIWLFRGTPLLVQILFLYSFLPYVNLANPLIKTHFFQHLGFTNTVPLDGFLAALTALALNEGAYMAEIVRAGIDSIDAGQLEAARSLGMTYPLAMRRIVLPQALRVIVPPLGNEFNSMLKSTSLAAFISVEELLTAANVRGNLLGAPLELLVVASFWYLLLTSLWSIAQVFIERSLNASTIEPSVKAQPWWRRSFGFGGAAVAGVEGIPAAGPTIDAGRR